MSADRLEIPSRTPRRRWLAPLTAAALVLAFGAGRVPLESRLTADQRAAHIGTVQLGLSLRERVGQLGFLAALSGFRSLVADFVWVEAYTAWANVEYGRLNLLLGTATTLQPHNVDFWEISAWHMAYNASHYALEDKEHQPSEALRQKAQREYILLGKDYAQRGLVENPQSRDLWIRLALIAKDKLNDSCLAADAYSHAAKAPRALGFEKRLAAYNLAACPGHEREAYWLLRSYYELGEQEHLPTLEKLLRELEEKLAVPLEQRVYKPR